MIDIAGVATSAPRPPGWRAHPRRLRRYTHAGFVIGLVLALVAFLIAVPVAGGRPRQIDITVRFEGRERMLVVTSRHPTVALALRQAKLAVVEGHLLAAMSHKPLAGHDFPASLTLNGMPALGSTELREGLLTLESGRDQTETTLLETALPIAPPPPPRVEHFLWHAGTPGSEDAVVGAVSSEVVSATNLIQPSAPRLVTETVVALTFDDGPWDDTPQFVQLLQAKKVAATFCMVGNQVRKLPDIARMVAAAGMTVCNHTLSHREHLDRAPAAVIDAEIQGGIDAQMRVLGKPPTLYRPPGGAVSAAVEDIANAKGEQVIGWAVDPKDYTNPGAPEIIKQVMAQVKPGAIVLMHDGGGKRTDTLGALSVIIDQLRAQGYGFVTPDAIPAVPLGPPLP